MGEKRSFSSPDCVWQPPAARAVLNVRKLTSPSLLKKHFFAEKMRRGRAAQRAALNEKNINIILNLKIAFVTIIYFHVMQFFELLALSELFLAKKFFL
ncbi:MAG: hypothetical protein SNG38_06075 [Rikenellaceae bacterium]